MGNESGIFGKLLLRGPCGWQFTENETFQEVRGITFLIARHPGNYRLNRWKWGIAVIRDQ